MGKKERKYLIRCPEVGGIIAHPWVLWLKGRKAKVSKSKRAKSKSDQEPAVVARLRSYKPSFLSTPYSRVCLEMLG